MSLSSYGALFELNPQNRTLSFGLRASLPLFTRFETSLAIARAEAAADDARHELRAARLALEREVRAALADYRNAYRSLELAERAAELSAERLRMAQERYRLGALSFTELQAVQDRAAAAEREALGARFEAARALVALEERLGRPLRP